MGGGRLEHAIIVPEVVLCRMRSQEETFEDLRRGVVASLGGLGGQDSIVFD